MKSLVIQTIQQIRYLLLSQDSETIEKTEKSLESIVFAIEHPLEQNIYNLKDTLIYLTNLKLDLLHNPT